MQIPSGSALGALNSVAGAAESAQRFMEPIRQRRRTTEYVETTTALSKRMDEFVTGLRENPEFRSYPQLWEEEQRAIQEDVLSTIQDPEVKSRTEQWYMQQSENTRRRVADVAWNRELAWGRSTIEGAIETARGLSDYRERWERIQTAVADGLSTGYIQDDYQAEEILQQERESLLFDQAKDSTLLTYSEDGYDVALNDIQTSEELNDRQKGALITTLNQMDAQQQRRAEALRSEEDMMMWRRLQAGSLTMDHIWDAQYLTRPEREHWEKRLQDVAQADREIGEGETTEEGWEFEARIIHDIDSGSRDRNQINSDIVEAHRDGVISRTVRDHLMGRDPMEDRLGPVWSRFDDAVKQNGVESDDADRMRRELLTRLREQFYRTNQDGSRTLRSEFREEHLLEVSENFVREWIIGDRIMKMNSRSQYRPESDENIFNRHNATEDNLRAIDQGHVRGLKDAYETTLNEMSYGHLAMMERLPQLGNVRFTDFDLDGRPLFEADTPRGPAVVAFFMVDPNTGTEYTDETPFMYSSVNKRWYLLPDGEPVSASGGGGAREQSGTPRSTSESQLRMQ